MNLTNDDVRDILRLLDSLPYTELRLETGSFRLALRRGADGEWTQDAQVLSPPDEIAAAPRGDPGDPDDPDDPDDPADDHSNHSNHSEHSGHGMHRDQGEHSDPARDGLLAVRAPLLGTFYRAPQPGAEPFVEVGGVVDEETVVGIIETMKLMNSVPAGVRGRVVEVCLGNAEFAERDAVLMLVDPE